MKKLPCRDTAREFPLFLSVAAVRSATLAAATVTVFMMVVTAHIRVKMQFARQQGVNRCIRITGYTAEKLNACLSKCHLCTTADTAADQNLYLKGL